MCLSSRCPFVSLVSFVPSAPAAQQADLDWRPRPGDGAARSPPSPTTRPRRGGTRPGMAGGAYFSALLEFGAVIRAASRRPRDATGALRSAQRDETRGLRRRRFPALGLSYYRLQDQRNPAANLYRYGPPASDKRVE